MSNGTDVLRRGREITDDVVDAPLCSRSDSAADQSAAPSAIDKQLAFEGFAFVDAAAMRLLLPRRAVDGFAEFARSWDRLGDDRYMADGGRYRRRRHAAFAVGPAGITRKPHQPHYQSRDYNLLNGGIERWFEPIEPGVATGPVLRAIINLADRLFTPPSGRPMGDWSVEAHQFRIEARPDAEGLPTPEGLHRDGVDFVLVMLIDRVNVAEGVTRIHGTDRDEIGSFCLAAPFDTALVDDQCCYHAVTPITPIDDPQPAYRDVLVVTFKAG